MLLYSARRALRVLDWNKIEYEYESHFIEYEYETRPERRANFAYAKSSTSSEREAVSSGLTELGFEKKIGPFMQAIVGRFTSSVTRKSLGRFTFSATRDSIGGFPSSAT
jgi:hypothetical protein